MYNENVGVMSKYHQILITKDGGKSFYAFSNYSSQPVTIDVRYAGSQAIIFLSQDASFRLIEDHLAPKPSDTITICGRVTFEGVGQPKIPVVIANRVTMTDSLGYYKFTRLPAGNYTVRAVNKYFDNAPTDYKWYYSPYIYKPDSVFVTTTDEICDIDFTAIDNRKYVIIGGFVHNQNNYALPNVSVSLDTLKTMTNQMGYYQFDNIESHLIYRISPHSGAYSFKP